MSPIEEAFEKACRDGVIPGASLLAVDRSGKFRYERTFGKRSMKNDKPFDFDTVMAIASCTKLMTSISALQCVERGLVGLDDDLASVIPELGSKKILTGFDSNQKDFILKENKVPITLRHLLTHTAGLAYDPMHPLLEQWRAANPHTEGSNTIPTRFTSPLVFEPGTSWAYGTGHDWAGYLVERLNPGETLDTYMQKNIFYPLGIKNIAFQVKEKPDMMANLADLSTRDPDGSGKPIHYEFDFNHSTRASGGSGAFATAPEYLKILESIMRDDEKLLTKETVDELFRPQLNEAGIQALVNYCKIPILYNIMGGSIPIDKRRNWGLSGTLAEDDYEGFYGANTQMWGGMPNLTWFIDRKNGLCALISAQMLPCGEEPIHDLTALFRKEIYKRFAESKAHL